MNGGTLDLPSVSGITALGVRIVGGKYLGDIAVFVGNAAGAGDHISTLQAALRATGEQALILGNGFCQEIVRFDPQIPGEGNGASAGIGITGVILNLEGLALTFGIVGDGQLYRLQNSHYTLCLLI